MIKLLFDCVAIENNFKKLIEIEKIEKIENESIEKIIVGTNGLTVTIAQNVLPNLVALMVNYGLTKYSTLKSL